ncbi:inositol-phosphate phosphatase [Oxalobacteraceae bacterium]|nr:inositol-phosphate phosphatase [Oxalobacteraceae bacterium]
MNTIDTEVVLEQLRAVGAELCEDFWTREPVIEIDEMFAAFQQIDGWASATLRAGLARAYPQVGWREGEFDNIDSGDSEAVARANHGAYWICDAIDGTLQYLRAIPNWAMSLTLIRDGRPVLCAVYDALHDDMFHAVAGGGAFRNGVAMRVNGRSSHYQGVVASSQPPYVNKYPRAVAQAGQSLSAMLRDVVAVRNLGPTSLQLAYVACGRLDAFWEFGEDSFNCIGPALLVTEAGGVVTEAGGTPYRLGSTSIAAAPAPVHASMLLRLQEVLSLADVRRSAPADATAGALPASISAEALTMSAAYTVAPAQLAQEIW